MGFYFLSQLDSELAIRHMPNHINADADAIIVASAIVNIIKNYVDKKGNIRRKAEMLRKIRTFVSTMKRS